MLREYRFQTIVGIWGGVLFFSFGSFLFWASTSIYNYFGLAIMLGGYVLFVCGCFMYVKGKGHSWYMGLFGILGPVGLLVLYVLKDYSKMILKKRLKRLK
ncbi:MAG: hypothetical protein ABIC68_00145 [Candidatus Omnitrophota bacterium]